MRKEIYKIKCPKHIIFGDPQYFEEFKGTKLKRLTVFWCWTRSPNLDSW